ncbi:glycosyltransferase family 9 protein [bacterium]|nr:glycosyltransferase family 9 protein [bacterium]
MKQEQQVRRIIIIDWSMIGDLVMLSPAVDCIAENYPDAMISILGAPASISVYKHHPRVSELLPYDRSKGDWDIGNFRAAARQLAERSFDLGFIFHNSLGSALMAKLGKVKRRVGYCHEMRDALLTDRLHTSDIPQHLIETKLDLLRQFGLEPKSTSEIVHIDQGRAKRWLREKLGPNLGRSRPIVGISLGATRNYKMWTGQGMEALINKFPVNSVDLVFLGAPHERALFEGVYSYNNTVVDLVGETTIEELTWVLDKLDLYIGPDSGPMHLATARQTPVVALFGATNPSVCGPYCYEKARIIRSEKICSECDKTQGKNINACLHTIDAAEVYDAAVELLGKYAAHWKD